MNRLQTRHATTSSWKHLAAAGGFGSMSPRLAENLSAVFACVDEISSALASLPPRIYRLDGANRELMTDGPLLELFRTPNSWQTWPDLVQWVMAEVLLYGNGLLVATAGGELLPCRWQATSMHMQRGGALRYDWQAGEGEAQIRGTADDRRMVHLRDRSDAGISGRSRLSRCAATIGLTHDVLDAAIALWTNGAFPSGALTLPTRVAPEEKARLREQVSGQLAGAKNRASVMILDGGAGWERFSVDPKDAETLETRQFQVEEICRVFGVPPPIIQAYRHNTFTNAATAGDWFARFTLAPWARKFEAAFNRVMLPPEQSLELDMGAFHRADLQARWDAYKIALEYKVVTSDEVRRLEGW